LDSPVTTETNFRETCYRATVKRQRITIVAFLIHCHDTITTFLCGTGFKLTRFAASIASNRIPVIAGFLRIKKMIAAQR
jgi:hypothetical protein